MKVKEKVSRTFMKCKTRSLEEFSLQFKKIFVYQQNKIRMVDQKAGRQAWGNMAIKAFNYMNAAAYPCSQRLTKFIQHFVDHLTNYESIIFNKFSFQRINRTHNPLNYHKPAALVDSNNFPCIFFYFFNLDNKSMRPFFRTWQINQLPCFGLTLFAKQHFRICNLSAKPYQTKCLFLQKHLSNSDLLPSHLLADILTRDFSQQSSQSVQVELQNIQARIKQTSSIDRDSEQLHFHLGACLLLLQRYEEAINQLRKAWLLNKNDSNYCIQIAVCLMESGNYFDAIKLLERQLRDNPKDSNLYHHLAIAYFNVENYTEAVFNFLKNYQIDQEISIDLINRGEKLFKGNRYIEAMPFYLKWLIHQRWNEKVINTLKDCFIQENQLEKGMQIYQSLGEVQQYRDVVEQSLALLYFQTGDIQKSLKHLEASISLYPNDYQLNLYLATAYFKQGRLQDAINHYLRCLSTRSSDFTVLSSLAIVYMKLNQIQKAQEFYQKSLKINENCSMSWYGYGLIHFQRNNIQKGIKCLEKAIQTDSQNYPAFEKLGTAYILLGEEQKGKKMFIRAQEAKKNLTEN